MQRKPSCRQRDTLANGLSPVCTFTTAVSNLNLNQLRMKALINVTLSDTFPDGSSRIAIKPPTVSSDESPCYDVIQSSMTSQNRSIREREAFVVGGSPRRWDENKEERGSPDSRDEERTRWARQTTRDPRGSDNFSCSFDHARFVIRLLSYHRHIHHANIDCVPAQSRAFADVSSDESPR